MKAKRQCIVDITLVCILYQKTRNAHWNIEGSDFHTMHKFFGEQYEQLDETMDEVAERIRILGHYAPATVKSYLELTHLTEQSREKNDSAGFIKEPFNDHESVIIRLRENINLFASKLNDLGTSDFITGELLTDGFVMQLGGAVGTLSKCTRTGIFL